MRDLFERLKSEGYGLIQELVTSQAQEGLQLDFKVKANPKNGELNRDDRGVLGAALSAFANSAGGLVLWGIDARPNSERVDTAQGAIPIPNLARFKSDVSRAVAELLMPRHEGIHIETIQDPTTEGAGYLAIWVERSERRPHRSEASGDKRYYKRAGDSTFVMEHYDIEDAFNRVAPADLKLVAGKAMVSPASRDGLYERVSVVVPFLLQNQSRLSACAPYVWIDKIVGGDVRAIVGTKFEFNFVGERRVISADATTFVHPGFDVPVFTLSMVFGHHLGEARWDHGGQPVSASRAGITGGLGCQNSRAQSVSLEWAGAALADLLAT